MWERYNPPLNRYSVCKRLILLFPELTEETADEFLSQLLREGKLKPNYKTDTPETAMVISADSWEQFEKSVYDKDEETKQRMLARILEKLEELCDRVRQLEDRLQAEGEEWKRDSRKD